MKSGQDSAPFRLVMSRSAPEYGDQTRGLVAACSWVLGCRFARPAYRFTAQRSLALAARGLARISDDDGRTTSCET